MAKKKKNQRDRMQNLSQKKGISFWDKKKKTIKKNYFNQPETH